MSDEIELSDNSCTQCFESMVRQDCWNCGGAGGFDAEDLMEEDPMWYDSESYEKCSECRGKGYFEWCKSCSAVNANK